MGCGHRLREAEGLRQARGILHSRQAAQGPAVDRRLSLREILEKVFGLIPHFKSKDELLEEEFAKFVAATSPKKAVHARQQLLQGLRLDPEFRMLVDEGNFADLMGSHAGGEYLRNLKIELRNQIVEYIKDYVPLNQFA